MKIGASFPGQEFGTDIAQIREFVQAAEALGYEYLVFPDHVLGAVEERDRALEGPYRLHNIWHEPFVVMSYVAALTTRIGFLTNVLILPQRQTALVAKQTAELDVLSGGRLRLGVGIGWNHVEYECLGMDFHTRGRRYEEQAHVLRALWTQPRVDFKGQFHTIDGAGINPLPVQQPIPLWFGGGTAETNARGANQERVLDRIGRLADGWLPVGAKPMGEETAFALDRIRTAAKQAGRDPASLGLEGQTRAVRGGPDDWVNWAQQWRQIGATHLHFATGGPQFTSVQHHIDALRRFKEMMG